MPTFDRPPTADTEPVRPPRRVPRGLVTAYFAGGLALLLVGTVAVFYLAVTAFDHPRPKVTALPSRTAPSSSAPASGGPGALEPTSSGPIRNRVGPQQVAMGKPVVIIGEDDAKFQITVRTLKFRKSGCDPYAVKAKYGGYLPTEITLKVISGEPEVNIFDFRFERPDGTLLDTVGGSGCEKNAILLMRRVVAGRTYKVTAVFDVPADLKGHVDFSYPYLDSAAQWKVR
ncbi:hypothetical protein ACWKSP_08050 [Micromonosporaceae bacterium Da 78-11]